MSERVYRIVVDPNSWLFGYFVQVHLFDDRWWTLASCFTLWGARRVKARYERDHNRVVG